MMCTPHIECCYTENMLQKVRITSKELGVNVPVTSSALTADPSMPEQSSKCAK